jgi:uncharacterized RDD family membrane protein YckC
MISLLNKRVFARLIDVLLVNILSFSISWGVDNNFLDDRFKIVAGSIFLFFTLTLELLDKQNRSFGKMIFGLNMTFQNSKVATPLNLFARRILSFFEVYFFVGLFTIYLNKGITIADIATGSEVADSPKN